ncbi:MAG: hypothetical protein ROR55_09705 [Devosia sp.]
MPSTWDPDWRRKPTVIETIGDLIDHGYSLHGHCLAGARSSEVGLEALAAKLGRDRSYIGDLPLRCQACGNRDVSMKIDAIMGMR